MDAETPSTVRVHWHDRLAGYLFNLVLNRPGHEAILTYDATNRWWRTRGGLPEGATAGTQLTATGVNGYYGWAFDGGENMALVGSDLTERSTAVTGADTALSSVTNLNIPQGTPVQIRFRFRKTAGAASAAYFGLMINATQVVAVAALNGVARLTNANEAQSGYCVLDLMPGDTNYDRQLTGYFTARGATGAVTATIAGAETALPAAAITGVIITGDAVNGAQTISTDELRVYTLA